MGFEHFDFLIWHNWDSLWLSFDTSHYIYGLKSVFLIVQIENHYI